jgi:hypothetical protein
MNSIEEKSSDFCPNYVQEFGHMGLAPKPPNRNLHYVFRPKKISDKAGALTDMKDRDDIPLLPSLCIKKGGGVGTLWPRQRITATCKYFRRSILKRSMQTNAVLSF